MFNVSEWLNEAESDGSMFSVSVDRCEGDLMDQSRWRYRLSHYVGDDDRQPHSSEAVIRLWGELRKPGQKQQIIDHLLETRGFVGAVSPRPTQNSAAHAAA